jgi:hypothetical protein
MIWSRRRGKGFSRKSMSTPSNNGNECHTLSHHMTPYHTPHITYYRHNITITVSSFKTVLRHIGSSGVEVASTDESDDIKFYEDPPFLPLDDFVGMHLTM